MTAASKPGAFEWAKWADACPAPGPGLHIVATPIGNLSDISIRALVTLAAADRIYCEDTRVTRRLLDRFGLTTPLHPYHDHNAAKVRPKLLALLESGATLALVSDAGTPLISDPGYKLVRAAADMGCLVSSVPGPAAAIAALSVAGLPTDRFFFAGFLPPKSTARRRALTELTALQASLVFYETPSRLIAALDDMDAVLGAREAAVCRELSKAFEEVRRGPLAALRAHFAAVPPKGEIVVIVGPPDKTADTGTDKTAQLDEALRAALAADTLKAAVAQVTADFGLPRKQVYARALTLTKPTSDDH